MLKEKTQSYSQIKAQNHHNNPNCFGNETVSWIYVKLEPKTNSNTCTVFKNDFLSVLTGFVWTLLFNHTYKFKFFNMHQPFKSMLTLSLLVYIKLNTLQFLLKN